MSIALGAAGGIALFLLAMVLLTDGLKVFAGTQLRSLLAGWTSTPLRGVFTGVMVTAAVQSSSAVTITTIGFVNAGLLSLQRALGVIFGANVGTTMTGWLVSLIGFGWKVDALAMPLLVAGVALRLLAANRRLRGLGEALTGFGLFFLALSFLTDAFSTLAETHRLGTFQPGGTTGGAATFLFAGLVATVLTQSSSAAIAIILSAASGGLISIESAAAAVIGANIGTTSTALVAVMGATPAAKRLALGHIAFNVVTGVIALLLLPVVLAVVARLGALLNIEHAAAPLLALFHTVFNVLGVLLMLPLSARLAAYLERWFRSDAEDLARPQHLDGTLVAAPALAVAALSAELARLAGAVRELIRATLSPAGLAPAALERQSTAIRALGGEISSYVSRVQTEAMRPNVAEELARALRTARYLGESARLAPIAVPARRSAGDTRTGPLIQPLLDAASAAAQIDSPTGPDRATRMAEFQRMYAGTKNRILGETAQQQLPIESADALLDAASALRRMIEQFDKAETLLAAGQPPPVRDEVQREG